MIIPILQIRGWQSREYGDWLKATCNQPELIIHKWQALRPLSAPSRCHFVGSEKVVFKQCKDIKTINIQCHLKGDVNTKEDGRWRLLELESSRKGCRWIQPRGAQIQVNRTGACGETQPEPNSRSNLTASLHRGNVGRSAGAEKHQPITAEESARSLGDH